MITRRGLGLAALALVAAPARAATVAPDRLPHP